MNKVIKSNPPALINSDTDHSIQMSNMHMKGLMLNADVEINGELIPIAGSSPDELLKNYYSVVSQYLTNRFGISNSIGNHSISPSNPVLDVLEAEAHVKPSYTGVLKLTPENKDKNIHKDVASRTPQSMQHDKQDFIDFMIRYKIIVKFEKDTFRLIDATTQEEASCTYLLYWIFDKHSGDMSHLNELSEVLSLYNSLESTSVSLYNKVRDCLKGIERGSMIYKSSLSERPISFAEKHKLLDLMAKDIETNKPYSNKSLIFKRSLIVFIVNKFGNDKSMKGLAHALNNKYMGHIRRVYAKLKPSARISSIKEIHVKSFLSAKNGYKKDTRNLRTVSLIVALTTELGLHPNWLPHHCESSVLNTACNHLAKAFDVRLCEISYENYHKFL